jgi:putative restriction endonuclease
MRTDDEVLEAFARVRKWQAGGERAPHKPLLLLLALSALQRGERWLAYREAEPVLRRLLVDFGPPRRQVHPELPFWRLRNDGIWMIPEGEALEKQVRRRGDVPPAVLRSADARGGFTEELFEFLRERPGLVNAIAARLLEAAFPDSLHEPILDATGVSWTIDLPRRRDPRFREEILRIYERRCAICRYDGRLGSADLGIEAAHVRWHAAGGPDSPENGLALCSFHHVALDRGALTLDDELRVQVSQHVVGAAGIRALLLRHIGREIRRPQAGNPVPAGVHLAWHRREVFRGLTRVGR